MYPELFPEMDGRNRKLRGFALSLAGSFVYMVTTVGAIAFSSQWVYLVVSGLSLSAVTLIFAAHRSRSFVWQVVMLMGASATLAAETGVVGLLFEPIAAVCAVFTLAGCLVAARGIHDVESIATLDPFQNKRRRELTVEQQAGGE